ncbi:extracellular solute-binding protein [Candidatus Aerophobetes bacterium]|nr:extracellular solute-binding protein [Candidatus Aerophobetes bacterium]
MGLKKGGQLVVLVGVVVLVMGLICSPLFAQKEITFLMWSHFVPAFNPELERQVAEWQKQHPDVKARVDFISYKELVVKLATEAEAGAGHDIVWLRHMDPTLYAESLIDVDDICEELGQKYGGWIPAAKQLAFYNGHWKAVPWFYWSTLFVYRADYFEKVGETREKVHNYTWEDLKTAAKKLTAFGNPGGFQINTGAYDSNDTLYPIMWSYGATTVNEKGEIVVNSPETATAIEYVKDLFPAMPPDVLGWDDSSNNRFILSGYGSWTFNSPSIWIAALNDFPDIAKVLDYAPVPKGPHGQFRCPSSASLGIWKFSKNIELAKDLVKFLLDKKQFDRQIVQSTGYNEPFLVDIKKHPVWQQLSTLRAYEPGVERITLAGWPGPSGPGANKVYHTFVVPVMFAKAVTGTPVDKAMKWAEDEIKRLYAE